MKQSTKNILLILIAILLVGGAFAVAESRNKRAEIAYTASAVEAISPDKSQYLDSDSDGAKDWEEILAGTDPHDAKSKTGAGSGSTITKDLTKSTEKLAPIDQVSRDFFARYMELRQMGISNDKLNQDDLVQKTVGGIVLKTAATYTKDEILVKADDSISAVKQYGNEVGAIFTKYAIDSRSEGIIAKDAVDKDDPAILKELDPIIISYKNIINALIKVGAPQSMAIIHLDLVNAMNSALFVTQSLRNSGADATLGLQAVGQYQITANKLIDSFKALRSYFSYLGVNYNANESGYMFTK